jgi:hypothetical protein
VSRHEDADRGGNRIGEWRRFSGFQSLANLRGLTWWIPSWLDRILPRFDVEAASMRPPALERAPS